MEKKLLLHITDLYAKDFPQVSRVNNSFNLLRSNQIDPYIVGHLQMDQKGNANWEQLLRSSSVRLMVREGNIVMNSIDTYNVAMDKGRMIIKEIDEELK